MIQAQMTRFQRAFLVVSRKPRGLLQLDVSFGIVDDGEARHESNDLGES